jgi:hypothetical protein
VPWSPLLSFMSPLRFDYTIQSSSAQVAPRAPTDHSLIASWSMGCHVGKLSIRCGKQHGKLPPTTPAPARVCACVCARRRGPHNTTHRVTFSAVNAGMNEPLSSCVCVWLRAGQGSGVIWCAMRSSGPSCWYTHQPPVHPSTMAVAARDELSE